MHLRGDRQIFQFHVWYYVTVAAHKLTAKNVDLRIENKGPVVVHCLIDDHVGGVFGIAILLVRDLCRLCRLYLWQKPKMSWAHECPVFLRVGRRRPLGCVLPDPSGRLLLSSSRAA